MPMIAFASAGSVNLVTVSASYPLALADAGVLALEDPVERFLPELADRRVLRHLDGRLDGTEPARRVITVEDLLTMRMGFGWVFECDCPAVSRAIELELGFGPPDPHGPPPPGEWVARLAMTRASELRRAGITHESGIGAPDR